MTMIIIIKRGNGMHANAATIPTEERLLVFIAYSTMCMFLYGEV